MLESLDSPRANRPQSASNFEVDGLESVAKELSQISQAVEAETKHSGERIRSDHGHGDQGPNQTGNGADTVQDHSGEGYEPPWGESLRPGRGQRKRKHNGKKGRQDGNLYRFNQRFENLIGHGEVRGKEALHEAKEIRGMVKISS